MYDMSAYVNTSPAAFILLKSTVLTLQICNQGINPEFVNVQCEMSAYEHSAFTVTVKCEVR